MQGGREGRREGEREGGLEAEGVITFLSKSNKLGLLPLDPFLPVCLSERLSYEPAARHR